MAAILIIIVIVFVVFIVLIIHGNQQQKEFEENASQEIESKGISLTKQTK